MAALRHTSSEQLELKREKDVDLASRVIWLHDPEHLTASNYRKKTLEKHKKPVLFKDELKLLVSILNSPLHRQSKSPTLWYHRYWCVKKLLTLDEQNSADDAAIYMQNLITEELGIVRKAAEQHPCNYYAWQYGRKVLTLLDPTCEMQILSEQCVQTFAWCRNHPSDISAFSFLLFIMKQSQDSVDIASVINQTLDWMRHLQWQGEAAWHFLRSLAVDVDLRLDIRCRDSIKQLVGGYFDKIIANRPSWQSQWEFMGTIAADLDRGHQDKSERP